jgi:hypothetical protein
LIRWHQTFDVGYVPNNVIPKVFMATAMDLFDDAAPLEYILSIIKYIVYFFLF